MESVALINSRRKLCDAMEILRLVGHTSMYMTSVDPCSVTA